MSGTNNFCSHCECISPATHFYFYKESQKKVCVEHLSDDKNYPIEQVYFITSPSLEEEYLKRKRQADIGISYLDRLNTRLCQETEAVLSAIEAERRRCIDIIAMAYDSEVRKTKQIAHCITLHLKKYYTEFSLYLNDKGKELYPASFAMTIANQPIPPLLNTTVFSVDFELSILISRSLFRDEIDIDTMLQAYIDPSSGNIRMRDLLRQSQEMLLPDNWESLHYAFAMCQEACRLRNSEQANYLLCQIQTAIESLRSQRISQMAQKATEDAKCVGSSADYYHRKFARVSLNCSSEIRKEKIALLEATLDKALPHSISKKTADLCIEIALQHYYSNPGESESWYQKALNIYSVYFPHNIETAITYQNLGNVYKVRENLQAAEQCYLSGLNVLKKFYQRSMEFATALTRYGETLEAMGRYEEARQSFQDALNIMNDHPDSADTAISLISAGKLNVKLRLFDRAEQCFLHAVKIRDRLMPNTKELAEGLTHLGNLYSKHMLRAADGESKLISALNILKAHFPSSKETARVHFSLSSFYLPTSKSSSKTHLKSAVSILLSSYPNDIDTAQACLQLADFYQRENSSNAAEDNYKLAVSILKRSYEKDVKMMRALVVMAGFYRGIQQLAKAETCLEDAIAVANPEIEESVEKGEMYFALGEVCRETDQREKAILNYSKARELFKINNVVEKAAACLKEIETLSSV